MRKLLYFIQKNLLPAALLLSVSASAQTKDPMIENFERMLNRMNDQMRRGLPGADSLSHGGIREFRLAPDSSYFYYRIDTSFNGSGSDFFQFSPFGNSLNDPFFNFDQLFQDFFGMGEIPDRRAPQGNMPADDGSSESDGLLPEERLRQKEEQGDKPQHTEPKAEAKKPKVKTIRI